MSLLARYHLLQLSVPLLCKKKSQFVLMAGQDLSSGPDGNHLLCKLQFPKKGQWYHSTLMLSYRQKIITVF